MPAPGAGSPDASANQTSLIGANLRSRARPRRLYAAGPWCYTRRVIRRAWFIAICCSVFATSCRSGERRSAPDRPSAEASAAPVSSESLPQMVPEPAASEAVRSSEWIEVSGAGLLAQVKASGYRAVIVNAWASWCGPCRREMPMLLALQTNLAPKGIGVFFVSVDEPSSRPAALAFLQEHGAPLPSYVAERPLGPFKVALNPKWPGMLPASFLIDASGKLRYFWGGEAFEHELLEVVDQFLAGTLVDGEARFGLAPGKVEGR